VVLKQIIDIFCKYKREHPNSMPKILKRIQPDDARFEFISPSHSLYELYQEKLEALDHKMSQEVPGAPPAPALAPPPPPPPRPPVDRKKLALELLKAEGFPIK
jgi:hypothetical protein